MFQITCDLTGTTGYAGCGCPEGHDPVLLGHHGTCQMSDFHAVVGCTATCCAKDSDPDHSHDPQSCPAEHPPGSCPSPASCKLWLNVRANHPDPDGGALPAECPGGHHGYGVDGCVVCHPLTITYLPDQPVHLKPAVV